MGALQLNYRKPFSPAAIHCVLQQTYPETEAVWDEALMLMSGLTGEDLRERGDAILMGDSKEIGLARGAKEALSHQLAKTFPTAVAREQVLSQSGKVMVSVAKH